MGYEDHFYTVGPNCICGDDPQSGSELRFRLFLATNLHFYQILHSSFLSCFLDKRFPYSEKGGRYWILCRICRSAPMQHHIYGSLIEYPFNAILMMPFFFLKELHLCLEELRLLFCGE